MRESAKRLKENRPNGLLLTNIFGALDGGRLPWADYVSPDVQNIYYEGYATSVELTTLLAFNFKKEIFHAPVNHPDKGHDSKLSY